MAWCQPGNKPQSEPMMVSSLMHICITRLQWVKDGLPICEFRLSGNKLVLILWAEICTYESIPILFNVYIITQKLTRFFFQASRDLQYLFYFFLNCSINILHDVKLLSFNWVSSFLNNLWFLFLSNFGVLSVIYKCAYYLEWLCWLKYNHCCYSYRVYLTDLYSLVSVVVRQSVIVTCLGTGYRLLLGWELIMKGNMW